MYFSILGKHFPLDKDIRQNGKLSPNSIARDYTNTHSYWDWGGVNIISVRKYSEINIYDLAWIPNLEHILSTQVSYYDSLDSDVGIF